MPRYRSTQNVLSLSVAALLCGLAFSVPLRPARAALEGVELIQLAGKWGYGAQYAQGTVVLPDGRLMVSWSEAPGETYQQALKDADSVERTYRQYARFSSDHGYNWSKPELLFEYPSGLGMYGGNASLVDADGSIHIFGPHHFRAYEYWKAPVFHVMSTDGGKSWTPPHYCEFGHAYNGGLNSVFQLRSGRIVLPVGYFGGGSHGWFSNTMTLSDDGGRTWRPSREEPTLDKISVDEAVGVQLQDGRLWLLLRTNKGYLYEAFSPDGDTWTKAAPSRFVSPGAPGGAIRLRDGRIVLLWNNSLKPAHSLNRLVLTAAISPDEGKTWYGCREIARVEPTVSQVMYPGLTQTPDDGLLVTFQKSGPGDVWKTSMLRLDPDRLMETSFHDDFTDGLDNWVSRWHTFAGWHPKATHGTGAATLQVHPDHPRRQVLRLRKHKADEAAGASLNFPFGVQGELTIKLQLRPGSFGGARICLTDYFTWPRYVEDGRFGFNIGTDGEISFDQGEDQAEATEVKLEVGQWHTLGFA